MKWEPCSQTRLAQCFSCNLAAVDGNNAEGWQVQDALHTHRIYKESTMRAAAFIAMMTLAFEAHAGRGGAMLAKDLTRLLTDIFHHYLG